MNRILQSFVRDLNLLESVSTCNNFCYNGIKGFGIIWGCVWPENQGRIKEPLGLAFFLNDICLMQLILMMFGLNTT